MPPPPRGSDKLEPGLRAHYLAWRDHHGASDLEHAKRTVDRWDCKDATFDAARGVSRCQEARPPNDAEYAELEAARLVVDPHVQIEVWLVSREAAAALEAAGVHLWSDSEVEKIQPIDVVDLHRTVYEVHILPFDLHDMDALLARPEVIRVRERELRELEDRPEPL